MPATALLDAGCGTGELMNYLSLHGRKCSGFDAESEMIRQAIQKAVGLNISPDFRTATLQNCKNYYKEEQFGGIFCLGNTIVHVKDSSEIESVLKSFFHLLQPGGKAAIQILNYDRILKKHITSLPVIEAEMADKKIRFYRTYNKEETGEGLMFTARLEITTTLATDVYSWETRLYPALRTEIETLLEKTGFCGIEVWEDYEETCASEESSLYLFTARKLLDKQYQSESPSASPAR